MSAPMPPKQDLRGGKASDDSFPMSNNIFVVSINRRFFATGNCELATAITARSRTRIRPDLYHLGRWTSFSERIRHIWEWRTGFFVAVCEVGAASTTRTGLNGPIIALASEPQQ
jgi:hypothetical protein